MSMISPLFRILPVLLFCCCIGRTAIAQQYPVGSDSVEEAVAADEETVLSSPDTATSNIIYIDTSLVANGVEPPYAAYLKLKQDESFGYIKPLDSMIRRSDMKQQLNERSSGGNLKQREEEGVTLQISDGGFWPVLFWIIVAAVLIWVIYRLFLADAVFAGSSKRAAQLKMEKEEEEVLDASGFEGLIRKALQQQNFRLAVRYHFLQTLSILADRQLIVPGLDKTNRHYLNELRGTPAEGYFAVLTHHYDYIWYGEFALNEVQYHRVRGLFDQFHQTLKRS